jgi:hypothetical protein
LPLELTNACEHACYRALRKDGTPGNFSSARTTVCGGENDEALVLDPRARLAEAPRARGVWQGSAAARARSSGGQRRPGTDAVAETFGEKKIRCG